MTAQTQDMAALYMLAFTVIGLILGGVLVALLGGPKKYVDQVTQDVKQTTSISALRRVIVFGVAIIGGLCALLYSSGISLLHLLGVAP